jgi:hypothetical protein
MLLVFGVRYLHTVIMTGRFHCPTCGGDRPYRLRRPRAWFHVFWLPLVPLAHGAPVVECGTCSARFLPDVLAVPTAQRLGELLSRGLRTGAAYVLTAQPVSPGDTRRAVAVLQRSLGCGYTRDLLEVDLAAHREGTDLGVLSELSAHLRTLGKERLLRRLAELLVTVSHSGDAHWRRLAEVAAALGVTPAHLRGIVDDVAAGARD